MEQSSQAKFWQMTCVLSLLFPTTLSGLKFAVKCTGLAWNRTKYHCKHSIAQAVNGSKNYR